MKHSLTNKDKVALTADCSVCGSNAPIVKNSKYGFACVVGRQEAKDRYKAAHPERVRQSKKRPPSKHRLEKRNGEPDICAVCGPVTPVVMGRGWGCPNRAKELGRTKFPESPQPKCLLCGACYLDRFGACPRCDEPLDETKFYPAESRLARRRDIASVYEEAGFTITEGESFLDNSYESAVPGWKTLGSNIPERDGRVLDAYAVLYGAGSL